MSKTTVKAVITQALKTPRGRPLVSKAEATAIAKAVLTEGRGTPHVTADEAKLVGHLLSGDAFDGGKKYGLTGPARQVLEAFAVSQGLPIGANTEAMKAKFEAVLANADLGTPLAKAPSTSSLLKLTLSDGRPVDGALREALFNPATASLYLRSTSQGRGQPRPVTSYYGPFPISANPPAGNKLSAAELGTSIAAAGNGYWFPSETDVSLRYLVGPKNTAVTAAAVKSAFTAAHDAQVDSMFGGTGNIPLAGKFVEEVAADDFLTRYSTPGDPNDPGSVTNAEKFGAVAALLKANLTDVHVYRFDEHDPADRNRSAGQVSLFIAGHTAAGELVSVMTGAVET